MPVVVEVQLSDLAGLTLALGADQRMMERAAKVAAMRAARWALVQVGRGLQSRLGVPIAPIRKRVKIRPPRDTGVATVRTGLLPLNIAVADPSKTPTGLHAHGQEFRGAFLARMKSGKVLALKREGARRLPVKSVGFDVAKAYEVTVDGKVWRGVNARFITCYQQELTKLHNRKRKG